MTDDHRQARRTQILDAAQAAFAAEGFQATGMAEVIAASGLSAGAVYRYFASKDELIEAIVDRVLEQRAVHLDEVLASRRELSAAEAVGVAVELVTEVAESGPVDITRLAVQAWGEGLRNPAVAAVAQRVYGRVRTYFAAVLRREVEAGHLPSSFDVAAGAAALLSVVLGYALQRLLMGDVDAASYRAAVADLLR
ncbi:TetR/AcrR family transcriptional regulator [Geodermatophilus sp. YIM 151500]|uniref:TetR/AcrR family transcriptional regulator n=1 Tax=Geodermatophilus sp. YIM 151500 TaxID=2984531 RepID=UPI0021E42F55|nr:TetR/AcrR family transcriptional regulator [Geodermatophilus sp. YIM 151500]MCV2489082.1 TetR/AcrR family transcriptional regulator [Geodermatophilus sp. YIM 151500]